MIITIWRHGEAGSAASDRQRELTDRGFDDIGFGCRQLHSALLARGLAAPALILFSPWVRTFQTAEIVASAFSHTSWREDTSLQPGGTVSSVESSLAALPGSDSGAPTYVVLVSHQPLVSQLSEHYLGRDSNVPSLSPGALVTFQLNVVARDCGKLLFWAAPPEYEPGM